MALWEEKLEVTCPGCGVTNHVLAFHAGDSRANEWEHVNCFSCGVEVASEKCAVMFGASTASEAESMLRKAQGRG